MFCSSTILDTRFGCITDDHSPVPAVLRCSRGFLQCHPSPCFDIVLPSCSWSSPSSFSRQTPFHDFLLRAVCSLSDNMAKEPEFPCYHGLQKIPFSHGFFHYPFICSFLRPRHSQNFPETLHFESSNTCFISLLQGPTFTYICMICCHWPHKTSQEAHFCSDSYVVTFPHLQQGYADASRFA